MTETKAARASTYEPCSNAARATLRQATGFDASALAHAFAVTRSPCQFRRAANASHLRAYIAVLLGCCAATESRIRRATSERLRAISVCAALRAGITCTGFSVYARSQATTAPSASPVA